MSGGITAFPFDQTFSVARSSFATGAVSERRAESGWTRTPMAAPPSTPWPGSHTPNAVAVIEIGWDDLPPARALFPESDAI
jgi:hypothetical protein